MSRADILNLPHIADKLAKLQAVHTDHEATMDRWNSEAKAQQKGKRHETRKPNNRRRRKRQDKEAPQRGDAPKASRSNGTFDEASGETDEGRGIPESEEVEDA